MKRIAVVCGAMALVVVAVVLIYPRSERKVVLRLYSGAGLRRAVDALCRAFEAETGIRVEPDYGGSGLILSRAREDKSADLFLPGDAWYVDQLQEKAGTVAQRVPVAYFVPTIIVAKGNPKKVRGLTCFARHDLRVGLGKPDACQIGRVSSKILAQAGVQIPGLATQESLTVNELGVWVKMKAVDAAIVWDAIAANLADDVDVISIPLEQNKISRVVLAQLSTSRASEAARRFLAFATSVRGRQILQEKGFRVTPP